MSRNVSAPPVDRSRLPEPGLPRAFTFPPIRKVTLPNGLRVWHVRHSSVPVITFTLLLRRGAADDPPGKEGLAALTADMLDEGSQGRSTIDVHEQLARLGAQLDSDIGSDAALYGSANLAHYIASKGGLSALTRAMARDLGPHGITVNTVSPGLTNTEAAQQIPAHRHRLYADQRVLTREQQPADVVGAVGFLLGADASYLTGQQIVVNGGFVFN